ncbi:uncharacterized protein RCC_02251 [Ramularia collo-cygni]|uniref:Uncharacterized protein n=1 Tax=Ramularia collo-cygni TaxID=112498 RepID=A0A2D3UQB9_9PEZI|nr:uncharacterized protein RCC_02251 [Ramularia collo-cygni]CZT16408.1 uncharacterized protein RCC_02251 [Ramularia collo-cygni]
MVDKAPPSKRQRTNAGGKAKGNKESGSKATGGTRHALTSIAAQQPSQMLRALERTDRQFWKETTEAQLSQHATDKTTWRSVKRSLAKHEISTLALNEVAAKHGKGMFFYLPSRDVWKPAANETLAPACRNAPPPGSQYPSIVFANCQWNDASTRDFYRNTHRARYLKANALLSALPEATPLYAIQYVHHADFLLFATPRESLVVFATRDSFYLTTTHSIGRKQGRVRGGVEPESRLEVPRSLWGEGDVQGSFNKVGTLEELYLRISSDCALIAGRVNPTISKGELSAIVPRPVAPDENLTAVALGTPFTGDGYIKTEPIRKRKGVRSGKDQGEEELT